MRKEKTLTLMEDGKELRFHLQQMSAFDFEHWLACLNQLLRNAGQDTPASREVRPVTEFFLNKDSNSPTKVTIIGKAKTALDLMEEMLLCAAYVDDQGQHIPLTPDVAERVIGQITTLLELRSEILRLNLDWALANVKDTPSLEPLKLPEEARYLQASGRSKAGRPVVGLCEALAMSGLASLDELKSVYSYFDALELERILRLKNYTTWVAAENTRPVWS